MGGAAVCDLVAYLGLSLMVLAGTFSLLKKGGIL